MQPCRTARIQLSLNLESDFQALALSCELTIFVALQEPGKSFHTCILLSDQAWSDRSMQYERIFYALALSSDLTIIVQLALVAVSGDVIKQSPDPYLASPPSCWGWGS